MLEELVAYLEGHLDILDAVSISLKANKTLFRFYVEKKQCKS